MSGHSKWSQIKRQKGVADVKKGNLFTKLANAITIAAKESGGDPAANFRLRLAVEKARSANMPNENVEKAIKRGTGELAGEEIQEMIFEGYGPGGIAVIIELMSSNRNRAASVIRKVLSEHGGKLGESGSVNWLFERRGLIVVPLDKNKEAIELKAIDAGAEDMTEETDGLFIFTKPENLEKVKNELEKASHKISYAEIEMVPKSKINLADPKDKKNWLALQNDLEENEEVNNFYSNADV